MNGALAAAVAKVDAAQAFNPRLFGALLVFGGALLIASAFPPAPREPKTAAGAASLL